jgi:hypothetical protein
MVRPNLTVKVKASATTQLVLKEKQNFIHKNEQGKEASNYAI